MGTLLAETTGGFAVTADMFEGLKTAVESNAGVIVPIGVGLMGVMLAIKLIPKIIKHFI